MTRAVSLHHSGSAREESSVGLAPVRGSVELPGSKSDTHRALLLAARARGETLILHASESEDTELLVTALKQLGVRITALDRGWRVGSGTPPSGPVQLDLGMAGSSLRFLVPFCATLPEGCEARLTGATRLRERPVAELVRVLNGAGAEITGESGGPDGDVSLPLHVRGKGRLRGGSVTVSGRVSSQFVSALLLSGAHFEPSLELQIDGPMPSRAYVDWTLDVLRAFGVKVGTTSGGYRVDNGVPTGCTYAVDGDGSGASSFGGIAAVTGGRIEVGPLRRSSSQGELAFFDALEAMGCRVTRHARSIEVRGPEVGGTEPLRGIQWDASSMPDAALTLAVVAAFAEGSTRISGLSTLPFKETDRLTALHTELDRMGISSTIDAASITIEGGHPCAARIATYGDHRMAMAFAVAGVRLPGLVIEDADVVGKSFPSFWTRLRSLGIETDDR